MKKRAFYNVIGVLVIAISLSPIYLTLSSSLKRKSDLSSKLLITFQSTLENYATILSDNNFYLSQLNTFIITIGSLIIVVMIGSITGYALARLKSLASKFCILFILGVMMIPSISLMVPLYGMMIDFQLVNSLLGAILIIATYALPVGIFIYTNFIKTVSTTLDEAAEIDGCNIFQTFYYIIMPQLMPVTITIVIIQGVKMYNNYMIAFYLLQAETKKVATTYLVNFFTENPQLNVASAAAILSSLPIIIIYLSLQKYFVASATEGISK